jgi:cytochrome b subunit of formate dehydrogenase
VEDAAILSLVASFSLILFAVSGWAMWRTLRSILETLTATAFVEIP